MSSKQRILQQGDGLATIKELLETVRDPVKISEAHEAYRKEIALTETEQVKADEARQFIAKYDFLLSELKQREDKLADEKAAHLDKIATFQSLVESKSKQLDTLSADLNMKAAAQADIDKRHATERKALDIDKAVNAKNNIEEKKRIEAGQALNEKNRLDNLAEQSRIVEYENRLKIKAAKLREQAQDI